MYTPAWQSSDAIHSITQTRIVFVSIGVHCLFACTCTNITQGKAAHIAHIETPPRFQARLFQPDASSSFPVV